MQGWECPRCHKIYAPHVDECKHCNEGMNMEEIKKKYFPNVPAVPDFPFTTPTSPIPMPYPTITGPSKVPQWPGYPAPYIGDWPTRNPFTVTCTTNTFQ